MGMVSGSTDCARLEPGTDANAATPIAHASVLKAHPVSHIARSLRRTLRVVDGFMQAAAHRITDHKNRGLLSKLWFVSLPIHQ